MSATDATRPYAVPSIVLSPGSLAETDGAPAETRSCTHGVIAVVAAVVAITAPLYGCFAGTGDAMTLGARCGDPGATSLRCYDDVDLSISCIMLTPTTGPTFAVGVLGFYLLWIPRFVEYVHVVAVRGVWRMALYACVLVEVSGAIVTIFTPMIDDGTYKVHVVGFTSWVAGVLSESGLMGIRVLGTCASCFAGERPDKATTTVVLVRAASADVSFVVIACAIAFRDDWGPLFRTGEFTILVLGLVSSLPMFFVRPRTAEPRMHNCPR